MRNAVSSMPMAYSTDELYWLLVATVLCLAIGALLAVVLTLQSKAEAPPADPVWWLPEERRQLDARYAASPRSPRDSQQGLELFQEFCDDCGAPLLMCGSGERALDFRCSNGHAWRETRGRFFVDFKRNPSLDSFDSLEQEQPRELAS